VPAGGSPKHPGARLDALASVLPDVDSHVVLPHRGHLANGFAPRKIAHIIEAFAVWVLH
jgi:hypothetical protein